ncbi:hypothetical protein MHI18_01910 [Peribacillus sp. FSL H8-0477]|uniref:hypothetical protein n=1 Tax=Peribacillus sp. FSL H8-0477 TaxID=2921388 RepID=UPI0030FA58B3
MKKMVGWTITLTTFLLVGFIYYFISLSLYEPSEDSFDFLIPKKAELIQENGQGKSYDWSQASEENGIPFSYKIALKANGWKKGESGGASVYYTKGNHKVILTTTTNHIDIIKVN